MIKHKQNVILLLEYLCTYLSVFYTSFFVAKFTLCFQREVVENLQLIIMHVEMFYNTSPEICENNVNIHSLVLSFTNIKDQ